MAVSIQDTGLANNSIVRFNESKYFTSYPFTSSLLQDLELEEQNY
jgi:hypothetical protein